jgi:hypothetical protein
MIIKFSMPRHINIKKRIYVVDSLFVAEGFNYYMFVRFNESLSLSFISHSLQPAIVSLNKMFDFLPFSCSG